MPELDAQNIIYSHIKLKVYIMPYKESEVHTLI